MLQPRIESVKRDPIFTINQGYKHLIKSCRNGNSDGAKMDHFN